MASESGDALARARKHLRQATLEGLQAVQALLDAAGQASGLSGAEAGDLAGEISAVLERLLAGLRAEGRFELPRAVAEPIQAALDREIERWELRSKTDADARPVLRAFLGLRELLWEFGLRPPESAPKPPSHRDPTDAEKPEGPRSRTRVQRFDIEEGDEE